MKFMVGVDCEGEAGVVGCRGEMLHQSPNWAHAQRQATREADAAVKGLFDAGATQVIVWDNHSRGVNLIYDELDERCDILMGVGAPCRWPTVDSSFAGVAMVGYHSMDNTIDGVLAHSFSSADYQYMKINGVEVGEIEIDASLAGDRNVPLIFVASDDKGVAEAKRFMPWVQSVTTKIGLARNCCLSKHPLRAANEIRQGLAKAAGRLKEMKTFSLGAPVVAEFRFKLLEQAERCAGGKSGWQRVDAYTCRKTVPNLSELF